MAEIPTFVIAAGALILSVWQAWLGRRKTTAEASAGMATADATTAGSALRIAEHVEKVVVPRLEGTIQKLNGKVEVLEGQVRELEVERKKLEGIVDRLRRLARRLIQQNRAVKEEMDDLALMAADALFELAMVGQRIPKPLPERVATLLFARAREEGVEPLFQSRQEDYDHDDDR